MFPNVQFVVTSHSPLFLLGLQRALGDDAFSIYRLPTGERILAEEFTEFGRAYETFVNTRTHTVALSEAIARANRPLLFVDGVTDVKYLRSAADRLGLSSVLDVIEVRAGGGEAKLSNAWNILSQLELTYSIVLLLHDCDSKVTDAGAGSVFRRKIDRIPGHPISKGIENLLTGQRSSVDRRTKRPLST